ncbi:MAG: hypothetical protein KF735_16655 [Chelatococcus sp.]|jgi:hypothetical protein|uniref:hypothetical protein n=1 Tax=Chelatococcus sp. TaxID=1953771 RepID=UPI0025BEB568|nr:hypothetical protein [Chelatococcus sp.]MBX3539276.1 hypothetical protein [Chelatococcus sp.]
MNIQQPHDETEFVTIIGSDMTEIHRTFQEQGLSGRQFAIVHRAGRHSFTMANADGGQPMFGGQQLIAATFARRAAG